VGGRIDLDDPLDLEGQFFLWELATAVAGAVIGVNPFDQPDVEAAKVRTRELTAEYERTGSLPPGEAVPADTGLADRVDAHLRRLRAGDYFALLAFLPRSPEHERVLREIRAVVRDRTGAATCAGFGPRYLHSTGQAHKGGPPSGVFLQLTCDPERREVAVPDSGYTFGVVQAVQARGDYDVLAARGRRVLRVDLGADVEAGLERLPAAVQR
jgi:hypothetical protein